MGKLHELLPVEGEAQGLFKRITDESIDSLSKKGHLYQGHTKTLKMIDETRQNENAAGSETKAVTDTVKAKLAYTWKAVIRYFDTVLQKEAANQLAVADLVVEDDDGNMVTLGSGLPATFLLGMESKLLVVRNVIAAAPTLPPGKNWDPDKSHELEGVYRQRDVESTTRTEKTVKAVELSKATDKHPAQVQSVNVDVVIGIFSQQNFHAGLTPHDKSVLLGRVERLIVATKQARQRANAVDVPNIKIGKAMIDFIMG